MKAIIIEDEPHSAELLAHLLGKHCPQLEIMGVFTDSPQALNELQSSPPDLLFLDIEMPHLNGFDLLNRLSPFDFRIIFTTAYDKYAVRAFKYSALDFLLKPIDIEELKVAVRKATEKPSPSSQQLEMLKGGWAGNEPPRRIAISTMEGLLFIETEHIVHCQSEGSYTHLHLEGGKKLLISKTLKEVEELLAPCGFLRIHHSHLINVAMVQRYIRGEGGEVVMSDGSNLPVARSKKEEFLKRVVKL